MSYQILHQKIRKLKIFSRFRKQQTMQSDSIVKSVSEMEKGMMLVGWDIKKGGLLSSNGIIMGVLNPAYVTVFHSILPAICPEIRTDAFGSARKPSIMRQNITAIVI